MTVTEPVSRARLPWATAGLELLVAAAACYGAVGLAAGNVIGMPAEWLEGSPFGSWVLPGVLLFVVVALPMGVAAVAELRRAPFAAVASVGAGAAQVAWIAAQLALFGRYNVLQPVMLACGLGVLLLALAHHRHAPLVPRPPAA
jgi:hypothetical protein